MSGAPVPSAGTAPRPSGPGRPRSSPSKITAKTTSDPILRNALRYTMSAKEYAALHKYILSKSRVVKRNVPTVAAVEKMMDGGSSSSSQTTPASSRRGSASEKGGSKGGDKGADTFNARAVRHSLRVFVATGVLMKLWSIVEARLRKGKQESVVGKREPRQPFYKSPTLRLSLSLSTILLLYRLLFRFLTRLRVVLLDQSSTPFRERNPRIAGSLVSPYAPAVGASLAGLALGIYPAKQLRMTMAIYMVFRALEFGWNALEDGGSIWGWKQIRGIAVKRERPWWFGSWMLQPFAFGQLLHSLLFDRDCFPKQYGDWIFRFSETYLSPPSLVTPEKTVTWLRPYEVVDRLGDMARMCWPPATTAATFPAKDALPDALAGLKPLVAPAHPSIRNLSCATLHPADPSCLRTNLMFWVQGLPAVARYIAVLYTALLIPRYKRIYHAPVATARNLLAQVLRMSTFVTGSIGTAWASICFFQHALSRRFLPTQRFFLGGFLAGMWAWVERRHGRNAFLYSARLSVDSLWKVGVKRRWWRAVKGGDVWLFALALAVTGVVYEKDKRAIREGYLRKGVSWARGTGFRDWGIDEAGSDEEDEEGFLLDG